MIKPKNNIGILGGTFDPPHKGHLKISKISINRLKLFKLFWVITKRNPFKKKPFYSVEDRVKKSKKLTQNVKKIQVCYFDQLIRSSNTVNLIKYFKRKNKNSNIFLIIGSDNLINFHRWKSWKYIIKTTKIVVFSRKDYDAKSKKSVIVRSVGRKKIKFINNKKINISSSKIRKNYLS